MSILNVKPSVDVLLPGFPIGSSQGYVGFCGVFLVRGLNVKGHQRNIVVDAAHVGRRGLILQALARYGLGADDIDHLFLTHAHWDHVQNIDLFEKAEILLHPDERRYIRSPHPEDDATPKWTSSIIERQRVREVSDGDELLPGVYVIDAPGHSAGSMVLAVETDAGLAVVAGDAIQNRLVASSRRNMMVFWDEKQANRTVEQLLSVADIIYPGHDRPFGVSGNDIEYLSPFSLTFTNLAADQKGLSFDNPVEVKPWIMPGIETQQL